MQLRFDELAVVTRNVSAYCAYNNYSCVIDHGIAEPMQLLITMWHIFRRRYIFKRIYFKQFLTIFIFRMLCSACVYELYVASNLDNALVFNIMSPYFWATKTHSYSTSSYPLRLEMEKRNVLSNISNLCSLYTKLYWESRLRLLVPQLKSMGFL